MTIELLRVQSKLIWLWIWILLGWILVQFDAFLWNCIVYGSGLASTDYLKYMNLLVFTIWCSKFNNLWWRGDVCNFALWTSSLGFSFSLSILVWFDIYFGFIIGLIWYRFFNLAAWAICCLATNYIKIVLALFLGLIQLLFADAVTLRRVCYVLPQSMCGSVRNR